MIFAATSGNSGVLAGVSGQALKRAPRGRAAPLVDPASRG